MTRRSRTEGAKPPTPHADPWACLSDGARAALLKAAHLLADGFTGEIILRCHKGGVRTVKENRVHDAADLRREVA